MTALDVAAAMLILVGFVFIFAGVIGLVRLPDFYTRLHAMGKCDTLGVSLTTLGLALHVVAQGGSTLTALKIVLIALFWWLANPTATHAIGRAAYRSGLAPWVVAEAGEPRVLPAPGPAGTAVDDRGPGGDPVPAGTTPAHGAGEGEEPS